MIYQGLQKELARRRVETMKQVVDIHRWAHFDGELPPVIIHPAPFEAAEYAEITVIPQMQESVDPQSDPLGIHLDDQEVISVDPRPVVAQDKNVAIIEEQLKYSDIAKRRELVRIDTADDTRDVGNPVFSLSIPHDTIKSNSMEALNSSFVFFKGSVVMTLQVTSQPFQAGLYILAFIPLTQPGDASPVYSNLNSLLLCPHAYVPIGGTTRVSLRIPFVHNVEYLNLKQFSDTLGTLVLTPLSPINVASTATGQNASVTFSLYAEMPDAEFKILDNVNIAAQNAAELKIAKARIADLESKQPEFDVVPQMGISVSKVVNSGSGGIDYDQTQTTELEAGAPLDKPNVGLDSMQVVAKSAPDMAAFSGMTQAYVLGDSAEQKTPPTKADFGTYVDEMGLSFLFGRTQWLKTTQLSVDHTIGQVLQVHDLCPNPKYLNVAHDEIFYPTLHGHILRLFTYWKCDWDFIFTLPLSAYHTARLAACTHYGRLSTSVTSIEDALAQYATIMDFNSVTPSHSVTVPYQAMTQMMKSSVWSPGQPGSFTWLQRVLGQLSLRVVSALRAPDSVAQQVDVLSFVRLKNVRVSMVREINLEDRLVPGWAEGTVTQSIPPPIDDPPTIIAVVPQAGDKDTAAEDTHIAANLPAEANEHVASTEAAAPAQAPRFIRDEQLISLSEIAKRPAPYLKNISGDIVVSTAEVLIGSADASEPNGGIMRWISQLYRVYKGGMVVTFLGEYDAYAGYCSDPHVDQQTFKHSMVGEDGITNPLQFTGNAPAAAIPAGEGVMQVKIPFQTQYRVLQVPRSITDTVEPYASFGFLYASNETVGTTKDGVYVAGADDFSFGYLYHVPAHQRVTIIP